MSDRIEITMLESEVEDVKTDAAHLANVIVDMYNICGEIKEINELYHQQERLVDHYRGTE